MGIFSYPKSLHHRRLSPGPYTQYSNYKPHLREEFSAKCVYCRVPDIGAEHTFGADHYRPKKLFPELVAEYSNLYYCCHRCNTLKGEYWPNGSETPPLPNPCDYRMFEHLRFSDLEVLGHSKIGEFALDWLELNDERRIEHRRLIETAAVATSKEIAKSRRLISKFEAKIIDAEPQEVGPLQGGKARAEANLARLEAELERLSRL